MKPLLKILLFLCILLAGTYAATPLWLPAIVARQLPPGWQLEKLATAYPDFSGISIHVLRLKGGLLTARLEITGTDIRFDYRGLKTGIDALTLDIFMQAAGNRTADTITLDDLSLPIAKLTGQLPQLSARQIKVILHSGNEAANPSATQPLVLDLQAFKLLPAAGNDFQIFTGLGIEDMPGLTGTLEIDVDATSRKAQLRFPAATTSPAWLSMSLEQSDSGPDTTTQLKVAVDADRLEQQRLDTVVARISGGSLAHVGGRLWLQADFAGEVLQDIRQLSLTTENLQAAFTGGTLGLDTQLLAQRDGKNISVSLPQPTHIRFVDEKGKLDKLIESAIPGLQRTLQVPSLLLAEISATSKFTVRTGAGLSAEFSGGAELAMSSAQNKVSLQAPELRIEMEDLASLDSLTLNGLTKLRWEQNTPITFTSAGTRLAADQLLLTSQGQLHFSKQTIDFDQAGKIDLQHPAITLSTDGNKPPTTVTAGELSVSAELSSHDGVLVSTGNGTLTDGHVPPLEARADTTEISWQDLDLLNLNGEVSASTTGLAVDVDDDTWTGFDPDVTFSLHDGNAIDGSGILKFSNGPRLPVRFSGNLQAQRWNLELPVTTVQAAQLSGLLEAAHIVLPEAVRLDNGYVDMQSHVVINDEISARLAIKGRDMGASLLENRVDGVDFRFDAQYDNSISADGPLMVTNALLAGGVAISSIGADLNLDDPDNFGLRKLHARVFGGRLNVDSLQFSQGKLEDTTIALRQVSLGQLLAFVDIDGLDGDGSLDITLPVGSDQAGMFIKDGTFSSNGPGRLAYTKEGVAGSNIGLQALQNFQFSELSGTINYQSDGNYHIGVRLEGNNPDLYGGHPVVFNLNIGGVLPELFDALFITGDFEESILNQVRSNRVQE